MLTFVLYLMFCSNWQTDFFPGAQLIPIPQEGDDVIIDIPKPTTADIEQRRAEADPVLTA